ncbi:MAG: hypothetical protein QHH07_03775 [Sedimentisphaerales bacterium]|nr:hypothetical protein [Sedimentisphaerales bacterium]
MNSQHLDKTLLAEWIVRSLDGSITTADFARLDHLICTDPEARRYYLEFISTYVGLVDLVGVLPRPTGLDATASDQPPRTKAPASSGLVGLALDPTLPEEERIRQIEAYAARQLEQFLEQQRQLDRYAARQPRRDLYILERLASSAAGLITTSIRVIKVAAVWSLAAVVLMLIGLYIYSQRPLGTLVATDQAVWDRPIEPNSLLRPGRYCLEQGYAKVVLRKGAELILQAPTILRLQGVNKIYLGGGCITAKVPPQARGFAVHTPGPSVVDFGTEFGLLVGSERSAELHVFEGFVACRPSDQGHSQTIAMGQAVTFDLSGRMERVLMAHRPRWFVRQMPLGPQFAIPGKRLSLADMVGGGSGLGTGIVGQGIDPSTGLVTSGRQVLKRAGSGFAVVPGLPYVDGVFVPDGNQGPVVISSTGIIFKDCPATVGTCFETILYGAVFQAGSFEQHPGRLVGRTFCTVDQPSIGMHPNAGITFDLEKIRSHIPHATIQRFSAICGISETAFEYADRDWDPNVVKTDFWVLVDGQVRFHKTLGIVPYQHAKIEIPIGPQDRFLTLVTTNPGLYRYCWAMFAEPALLLGNKTDDRSL